MDLFMVASREKFRFASKHGNLSTEDLWDLPLVSLDEVAKSLDRQIKESSTEHSFIKPATTASAETQAKFEIVLYVIQTKIAERDEAVAKATKAANKQKIMALIERKKDAELENKSAEELQALLASM